MFAMLAVWQAFADDVKTNEWGAITNNVQMSINLKGDRKEIKSNQPFRLLIFIRNVSTNEAFNVHYTYVNDYDLSFVVIAPSGKDISPIFPKDRVFGSGAFIFVPPGQIKRFGFNLSFLCKFDEVGTYKIIAKQKGYWSKSQKDLTIVSNPLCVTVVPDK